MLALCVWVTSLKKLPLPPLGQGLPISGNGVVMPLMQGFNTVFLTVDTATMELVGDNNHVRDMETRWAMSVEISSEPRVPCWNENVYITPAGPLWEAWERHHEQGKGGKHSWHGGSPGTAQNRGPSIACNFKWTHIRSDWVLTSVMPSSYG